MRIFILYISYHILLHTSIFLYSTFYFSVAFFVYMYILDSYLIDLFIKGFVFLSFNINNISFGYSVMFTSSDFLKPMNFNS